MTKTNVGNETMTTYKELKTGREQDDYITQAMGSVNMKHFLTGFAKATQTRLEEWVYSPILTDIGGTTRATFTHGKAGASFVIRFVYSATKPTFTLSASVPRFLFGRYMLNDLLPNEERERVPSAIAFSADKLANDAEKTGKSAGKRLGNLVISVWHFVEEKKAQEAAYCAERLRVIAYLESEGWKVMKRNDVTRPCTAHKPGCVSLSVDQYGTVTFDYKYHSAPVERMARAAALICKD